MALKPCVGCSYLLSETARRCPKCSLPVGRKSSSVQRVMTGFFVVSAVLLPLGFYFSHSAEQKKQVELTEVLSASLQEQQWQYTRKKLGDGDILAEYAHLMSSNQIPLQYPYQTEQQGYLSVMKTADRELVISTGVLTGQLSCSSVPCVVLAQFDDAPAQRFDVSFPTDGAQDTVLISNAELFIEQLKHSTRLQLELEFYQDGPRKLEFALLNFPLQ